MPTCPWLPWRAGSTTTPRRSDPKPRSSANGTPPSIPVRKTRDSFPWDRGKCCSAVLRGGQVIVENSLAQVLRGRQVMIGVVCIVALYRHEAICV